MTDWPILFNDEMVRAILSGQKTQTRRPVVRRNSLVDGHIPGKYITRTYGWDDLDFDEAWMDPGPSPAGNEGPYLHVLLPANKTVHRVYSRIQPGDRLWVREAWASLGCDWAYRATAPDAVPKWRPSIHMPRVASRIFLEVETVRVERVQDISTADILAEGVDNGATNLRMGARHENAQRLAFRRLWDSIYGGGPFSWDAVPFSWVWVNDFRVLWM